MKKNESVRLSEKIKFKHGDKPQKFTIVNDGYYLQSSQNLMHMDMLGEVVFHTHINPPDLTFGQSLSLIALLALDTYASSLSPFSFPSSMEVPEFKNSSESDFYLYMLKKNVFQESSRCNGIVRINYFTGVVDAEICLRTNTPIYAVDETNDCLYYVKEKTTIISQSW